MPVRKPTLRVVGYPRVSDESIKIDSGTIESQIKAIRTYVEATPDLVLEGMYPEAMTAYMKPFKDRPEFMKVMDLARKGLIDGVVVTEFSRLSRRQGEQAVIVELLRGYNVKVYSCTENFDDSALGQFMRAAAAFSAESEREKVVYRTSRGMRDRVEAGNLAGRGFAAYGYNYADTEKYTKAIYVINEEEATWVVWIFERAVEGWSARQIARTLNEKGVPTKTRRSPWHYGTVRGILLNPFYTGTRASAYRYKQSDKGHSVQLSVIGEIKLPENVVPQIVSEDLFDTVQRQIANNKETSFRNNQHPKIHLMRSLLRCGICGHTLHVDNRVKKGEVVSANYFCCWNRGANDVISHHSVSISYQIVDPMCWEIAVEHIKNPDLIRERVDELRSQNTTVIEPEKIKQMLKDIHMRYLRLFDLAESTHDEDVYNEIKIRLGTLEKEKQGLQRILTQANSDKEETEKIEAEIAKFEAWTARVRPLLEDPSYEPNFDDKLSAVRVLGIRGYVWPVGSEQRIEIRIAPPSIMQVLADAAICERDFTIALS